MPEIGKRIRLKREQLGITQDELAKKMGYKNKSTIAKIENGTNDIVQSKVVEFASILRTSVAFLMGWNEIETKEPALTSNDEHDIARDLDRILQEIEKRENSPLYYKGSPLNEKHLELLKNALDLALDDVKNRNANDTPNNTTTSRNEESCTVSPITLFTNVDDARKFLKSRNGLAAWQNGTLTNDDIINMANGIINN